MLSTPSEHLRAYVDLNTAMLRKPLALLSHELRCNSTLFLALLGAMCHYSSSPAGGSNKKTIAIAMGLEPSDKLRFTSRRDKSRPLCASRQDVTTPQVQQGGATKKPSLLRWDLNQATMLRYAPRRDKSRPLCACAP